MQAIDDFHSQVTLFESEAKFRMIANAIPQMVWSTLPDGTHDYYNVQWGEFTGIASEDMQEEEWHRLIHPDDQAQAWARWNHSLATGEPYETEYRLRHRSGQFRWCLSRALPLRADDKHIVRWMGTCTDIHEQKLAQEKLQHADRRKDEFLAMLAHELRNPLAPIMTSASLLSVEPLEPGRIKRISEVIYRQTRHMTGLIDDLIDVSRVTRGLIKLEDGVVDLKIVLGEACEQVHPLFEKKGHRLETAVSAEKAYVQGDHKRLVQVVANLLTNAGKYTPPGGVVRMGLEVGETRVRIAVRDNGIGMPCELIHRVFDLFAQGERSLDRSEAGLGIGLALVRSLVEQHGGSVAASSEGTGKGSEFVVELPRLADHAIERRKDRRAVPAISRGARSLRILVVDDNVDAAQLLGLLFQEAGHEVHLAYDAGAALAHAGETAPHVCFLDIGLPSVNGLALARQLRAMPALRDTVLVAVTGHNKPGDQAQSATAGFDHHFQKPVDVEALSAFMTALAERP